MGTTGLPLEVVREQAVSICWFHDWVHCLNCTYWIHYWVLQLILLQFLTAKLELESANLKFSASAQAKWCLCTQAWCTDGIRPALSELGKQQLPQTLPILHQTATTAPKLWFLPTRLPFNCMKSGAATALTCTSFASQTQLLPGKMGRFPAPSLQLCCFTDGFSSCLNHGWRKVLLQAPKEGTNHGQVIHSEELCKKEQESGKKVVGYPATFRDSSCKGECLKPNSITGLNCKLPPLFPAAKRY